MTKARDLRTGDEIEYAGRSRRVLGAQSVYRYTVLDLEGADVDRPVWLKANEVVEARRV